MCTYMYMYVIWIKGIWGSFMMHFKECIWEARFETNCNRLEKGAVRLKSEWAGKLVLESTGCPNQQNQVDCWKYEIWMVEQICSWARLHGQRRSHICLNPKRYRKQGSGGHSCTQWGYMLQKVMCRLNECQIYMFENKACRRNSRAKKQNSGKSNCKDFFAHTNPMLSHALVEIDAETWHVYFQRQSYEIFVCLKISLKSK